MANYNVHPAYDINAYLWKNILDNEILNQNDYIADGFSDYLVPIVPAQQIPEFNNLLPGQTYLIYDYEEMPAEEHWWISSQIITYSIVSPNNDKINQIVAMMKDIFRRFDDSARDINSYSGKSKYYDFHYISIDSTISPQHFSNEGGFMMGEIKMHISYTRKLDSNGRYT